VSLAGHPGIRAASAVAVMLLLTGCRGSSSALPDESGSQAGSPSLSAATPTTGTGADGPVLTKVRGAIARNQQQRISIRGTVTHRPAVASVTGTSAVVEDCYDVSGWDPVDVRTGEPIDAVDAGGTGRYRGRFGLQPGAGAGGWRVVSSKALGVC
jgi:hypothetical protein